jgi:citrate lyase beta subunit
MTNLNYYNLGASLYVPSIHNNILQIAIGEKFPNLKSVIFDMEDSIFEEDLQSAYNNLGQALTKMKEHNAVSNKLMRFIRIRKVAHITKNDPFSIWNIQNIDLLDGIVLPKANYKSLLNLIDKLKEYESDFKIMPIFEDSTISDIELNEIKDLLVENKDMILSIRIGATDILSKFNLRRSCGNIIYDFAPVSYFINKMVSLFKPCGFNITGTVYECFSENKEDEKTKILEKETKHDLLNGLFGKTIIHPFQIDIVEEEYKVAKEDLEIAKELLNPLSAAVFKMHDKMNEKATHTNWAIHILKRADIYGIKGEVKIEESKKIPSSFLGFTGFEPVNTSTLSNQTT